MTARSNKRRREIVSHTVSSETAREIRRRATALNINRSQLVEISLREVMGLDEPNPNPIAPKIRCV